MDIAIQIFQLFGGLAIFLYSMKMMSNGLEAVAGNKLKKMLEKLTSSRFFGLLVGTGITVLIQSSSATTVMTVGFVNAGLMNLRQALWVIMGANIGTNITSQIIAFNVGDFVPVVAIVGVAIIMFASSKKYRNIGEILAGFGFIFISMSLMSSAMEPFADSPELIKVMTMFDNPLLGILVGAVLVAIIQSSSAGVGILQVMAMASAGAQMITLDQAIFILYGMNIGTCITAILSSIGTSRMAKRTALMHLTFNVIGMIIWTTITLLLPFTSIVKWLSPGDVPRQIANAHLIFNVGTTILLLPFGGAIVKFVSHILPERASEKSENMQLLYLAPSMLKRYSQVGSSAAFLASVKNEVGRMFQIASTNVENSLKAVLNNSEQIQAEIDRAEEYVDYLNKEISYYISHCLSIEMSEEDAIALNGLFTITGNIERMSDHATNIAGYASLLEEKGYKLSDKACDEIKEMIQVMNKATSYFIEKDNKDLSIRTAQAEQKIDDMTVQYRSNQLERMRTGVCSGEACVIYSEMLTDFERLGDHLFNIARAANANEINSLLPAEVQKI